jgi:hypothetical protein
MEETIKHKSGSRKKMKELSTFFIYSQDGIKVLHYVINLKFKFLIMLPGICSRNRHYYS